MKKILYILMFIVLVAGCATMVAFRWQAWYGMPVEEDWDGEIRFPAFETFSQDSTPDTLQLLVLGDIHNSLSRQDYCRLGEMYPSADALLQLGDWIERPYFYYEQMLLDQIDSTRFATLPVLTVPGNHEFVKGIFPKLSTRWTNMFLMPENGPIDFIGSTWYADFEHARIIGIDTHGICQLRHFTRLVTWLHGVIREADGRFVIVAMHEPLPILRPFLRDADLVLAGHKHIYQRKETFVITNASTKFYHPTDSVVADCYLQDTAVYHLLTVTTDSIGAQLMLETRALSNDSLVDHLTIDRR